MCETVRNRSKGRNTPVEIRRGRLGWMGGVGGCWLRESEESCDIFFVIRIEGYFFAQFSY